MEEEEGEDEGGEDGDLGGGAIKVVLFFLALLYARRGLDGGVGSSSCDCEEAIS
jgi:hypothetical protein